MEADALLLRTVCHELRPPVSTLAALLRALDTEPSEANRASLVRLGLAHLQHAEAVLAQVSGTAQGLDGTALPLYRILPVVAATVPAHRLVLDVSRAAGRCPVHPQHTRQILINLLDNATRHGRLDRRVALRARRRGHLLQLRVLNAAPATTEVNAWLHQSTPPTDSKGLGLWVVRHLVAAHRGRIVARPVADGVAVEVLLPRA